MANLMFHKGHLGNLPFAQNKFPLCRQNCPTLHCIDVTAPRACLAQKITMAMQWPCHGHCTLSPHEHTWNKNLYLDGCERDALFVWSLPRIVFLRKEVSTSSQSTEREAFTSGQWQAGSLFTGPGRKAFNTRRFRGCSGKNSGQPHFSGQF